MLKSTIGKFNTTSKKGGEEVINKMEEATLDLGLLKPGNPSGGSRRRRGPSLKTQVRIKQLKANKGKWFIYAEDRASSTGIYQAVAALSGIPQAELKDIERSKIAFESTSRRQSNGKYTIYVRYIGKQKQYKNTPG